MTQQPRQRPTQEQIQNALGVLDDYRLHYYQLLYFQSPKLTQPGKGGYPFEVRIDPEHMACINIIPQKNKDYTFSIRPWEGAKDQDAFDVEVVTKCKMILGIINEKKDKFHSKACCPLAVRRPCVCDLSYTCELHGTQCHGSHD